MLRVSEVAERLNCSIATVYKLIETQQLQHYRCAGIRVSEEQLAEFLESRKSAREQRRQTSRPRKLRLKHIQL